MRIQRCRIHGEADAASPKQHGSRVLTGDCAVPFRYFQPAASAGMRERGCYGVVVECLNFVLVLWYT